MTIPQPLEEISTETLLKEILSRTGGHEAMVRAVESGEVSEEVKNVKPSEVRDECEAG